MKKSPFLYRSKTCKKCLSKDGFSIRYVPGHVELSGTIIEEYLDIICTTCNFAFTIDTADKKLED